VSLVALRGGSQIHATGGDIRRICDLFGLTVEGATRYLKTVEHPDLTTPGEWVPRTWASTYAATTEHAQVPAKNVNIHRNF